MLNGCNTIQCIIKQEVTPRLIWKSLMQYISILHGSLLNILYLINNTEVEQLMCNENVLYFYE